MIKEPSFQNCSKQIHRQNHRENVVILLGTERQSSVLLPTSSCTILSASPAGREGRWGLRLPRLLHQDGAVFVQDLP